MLQNFCKNFFTKFLYISLQLIKLNIKVTSTTIQPKAIPPPLQARCTSIIFQVHSQILYISSSINTAVQLTHKLDNSASST